MKHKGTKNTTYTQRLQLEALLKLGMSKAAISRQIGLSLTTIYRELKRGKYMHKKLSYTDYWGDKHYKMVEAYSAELAEQKYRLNLTACGPTLKIANDYDFVHYIEKRVGKDKMSPSAVLGEIKREKLFKTDISKTTLYRYIDGGVFYNLKMSDLPCKRTKKKYRKTTAKRPPKGTSIEQRPQEILDRLTFGHWEMDCVVGKKKSSNVLLTLSERYSRFELIFKMPNRKAESVVNALNCLERRLGEDFSKIFKTITVDNGVEFSNFEGMETSVYGGKRVNVYYCHPYTSCERGTNERLNRDIRRHFPKGTDFSEITDAAVQNVADWMNDYPREIFGFRTAREIFNEQLAAL